MANWGNTMVQSFEYWEVDRGTWGDARKLDTVLSCRCTRDESLATRETATVEIAGEPLGETVVRCYMNVLQGRSRERFAIGTWLAQGSVRSTDGRVATLTQSCHSPLMPLSNRGRSGGKCPVGYMVPAGSNCASVAEQVLRSHGVAPVVASASDAALDEDYVAGVQDSWLDVARALADAADMSVGVDEWGRVVLAPSTAGRAMAPKWTFSDGDGSLMLPDASEELDLYDVPNVCEAIWQGNGRTVVGRAVNDSADSQVSTASRGYEVVLRLENPDGLQSGCTQATANLVAQRELRAASEVERKLTISHGWCGTSLGDPVRVDYEGAGIVGDGRVTAMDFTVGVGMTVTSTVSVSQRMW